jgi:uncharacterized protein DUF4199
METRMRIALKYGLLITLAIMLWVVIAHVLVPNPESRVHSLGALVFFNLVEIVGIYFGIKARQRESAGRLKFREAVKIGVFIAFVYAISSCLFFLIEILVLGPGVLAGEPGAQTQPLWQVALGAFGGLFFFAVLLGLVYSTIIASLLAMRREG